jgi:hypothetical protein
MTTIFTLKGCNPIDFVIKHKNDSTAKGKYDILHPGKVSHTTGAGGVIRVLQRGNLYCKNGTPYDTECTKQCWWHRKLFDNFAMGIPVRVVYSRTDRDVYMDGVFCSYSCALAWLEDHFEKIPSKRDPNYSQSIVVLKQLFEEEFPGEDLVAALDWRLQKDVGNGNMTTKDYMAGLKGFRIVQHPNLSYHAVTVTYDIINQ